MALVPFPAASVPPPVPEEPPDDDRTAKMSFLEHLDELRTRLIRSVTALVAAFLICLFFIDKIQAFIMKPLYATLPRGGSFIFTEPTEGFMLQMKIAALAGVFLAAPVILWQLWKFIAPGLYSHEKKFAIPFVLFASVFFAAGGLFSHYVAFPWAWMFFASYTTEYMTFMPKVSSTFSLYAKMLLGFGVVFQMPTLVFFLARVGGITARFLIRNTKYAILIIFIVAAVLSPGTDVVSQALMAGPMLLLYAISIVIAWVFGKKKSSAPL
jgi:sec-independent protein translocase protein TatC